MSNLLLMVVVARATSAQDFGIFALVILVYVLAVTGLRSVVSTPMLMSVAGEGAIHRRKELEGSLGTSLLAGLLMGGAVLVVGVLMGGGAGRLLVALGILIPGLLIHDAVRYAFIAEGASKRSAMCDIGWLVLQVVFTAPLVLNSTAGVMAYTLAWGIAGMFAAAGGLLALRIRPSLKEGRRFVTSQKHLIRHLTSEYLTASAVIQLSPYAVALVAGVAAAGALRAGLILLGVLNVVIMGMTPLAQIEATKIHKNAPARDYTVAVVWAALVAGLSVIYGILLVGIPSSLGHKILGDTWEETSILLLPLAICMVARSPYYAVQLSLRARVQLRAASRLRLITAPFPPAFAAIGAWMAGAEGAAWGFAVADTLISVIAWQTLRRVARRQLSTERVIGTSGATAIARARIATSTESRF